MPVDFYEPAQPPTRLDKPGEPKTGYSAIPVFAGDKATQRTERAEPGAAKTVTLGGETIPLPRVLSTVIASATKLAGRATSRPEETEDDETAEAKTVTLGGETVNVGRALGAIVAAVPLAIIVALIFTGGLWWFYHALFPLERAASCGVSFGFATLLTVAVPKTLPKGLIRKNVVAAITGLWAALLVGWFVAMWTNPKDGSIYPQNHWWLAFALAAFGTFAGVPAIRAWRPRLGKINGRLLSASTLVVVLLLPGTAFYWLWNQSAHFGTAGEASPVDAANAFMDDAIILGQVGPGSDIGRLMCDDPHARHVMNAYINSWRPWMKKHAWQTTTDFLGAHVISRQGAGAAKVRGQFSMSTASTDGSGLSFTTEPTPITFTTVKSWDGWRACGMTIPGWNPDAPNTTEEPSPQASHSTPPSDTPSPAPAPSSPTPSPSDDDNGVITPPTSMLQCGPDDPYRDIAPSLGWYTCPPDK
jgi:hypothetical protein